MGSISTWHVTLKHRCAGAQGHWTSMPRTIQNSMRQSISASPPMSMDLHTPTRSDYDYTVRSVLENQLLVYIHNWCDILLTGDVQGSDLTHQYPNTKQSRNAKMSTFVIWCIFFIPTFHIPLTTFNELLLHYFLLYSVVLKDILKCKFNSTKWKQIYSVFLVIGNISHEGTKTNDVLALSPKSICS